MSSRSRSPGKGIRPSLASAGHVRDHVTLASRRNTPTTTRWFPPIDEPNDASYDGVGWDKNVYVHLHTMVMLRYEIVSSIWGGVGQ